MNYTLSDLIICAIFEFGVRMIRRFSDSTPLEEMHERYRLLAPGTAGKAVADCLDRHGYTFVPGFTSHDLKHVLLDYDMTPTGEVRLQAFMLGNGNWSAFSLLIFSIGMVFKPFGLRTYLSDFRSGRQYPSVKEWTLENSADYQLQDLKQFLAVNAVENRPIMDWPQAIMVFSLGCISLGGLGLSSQVPLPIDATLIVAGLFGISIARSKNPIFS